MGNGARCPRCHSFTLNWNHFENKMMCHNTDCTYVEEENNTTPLEKRINSIEDKLVKIEAKQDLILKFLREIFKEVIK